MSIKLLLAALVAALALTACGTPAAGTQVLVSNGAEFCSTYNPSLGEWAHDTCGNFSVPSVGTVEDHPDGWGHHQAGALRVRFTTTDGSWVTWVMDGGYKEYHPGDPIEP